MYYILDKNKNICGILSNDTALSGAFYDDLRTVKLVESDGKIFSDELTISVPYESDETELINEGYFFLKEYDGKYYLFRIYAVTDTLDESGQRIKKADCFNACIWDMYHRILTAKTFKSIVSTDIFEYILQNTGWRIDRNDFAGALNDITINDGETAQSVFNTYVKEFGAEIDAYVTVRNGQIFEQIIDIYEEISVNNGLRLEYRQDIQGITRTIDNTNFYTKLFVSGKDGVTFASINDGRNYIVDDDANDLYNNGDAYLEGYITNDSIANKNGLLSWAQSQFSKYNKPAISYDVTIANLATTAALGETVRVIDFEMNKPITVDARVIEKQESEANPENNKIIIGEYVEVKNNLPLEVQELRDLANQALKTADNSVYRVEILATNGTTIKNGKGTTDLLARVYKDNILVHGTLDQYVWEKIAPDGTHVEEWENAHIGTGERVTVSTEDFIKNYSYRCNFIVEKYGYITASYYLDGMKEYIKKLSLKVDEKTVIIPFITDTHYNNNDNHNDDYKARLKENLAHMYNVVELSQQIQTDLIVHGGDMIDGRTTHDMANQNLYVAWRAMSEAGAPLMVACGNHDNNFLSYTKTGTSILDERYLIAPMLSKHEISQVLTHDYNKNDIVVGNAKDACYAYYDIENKGIRAFVLDSYDFGFIPMADDPTKVKYSPRDYMIYSQTQLEWLADNLESTPAGYSVIVFSHALPGGTVSETQINDLLVKDILNAWKNGGTYNFVNSHVDFGVNFTRTFAGAIGDVIAVVSGHVHKNETTYTLNEKTPMVTRSCSTSILSYSGESTREFGTINTDAWDCILIKLDQKTVQFIRFGNGNSSAVYHYA